jgi:hypothetical protein
VDFFEGVRVFSNRSSDAVESDWSPVVFFSHGTQETVVHFVESMLIDF